MKKLLLLLFLLVNLYSQTTFELFPDNLTIQPFTANMLEPKLGALFQTGTNELRLDIGNSIDLLRWVSDGKTSYSIGADLFTYTLLRKEKDFHFPVDAVDYLFGLNFGYKNKISMNSEIGLRVRLSHISAHMVDGHLDKTKGGIAWLNNQDPIVYSREFIEFFPYYKYNNLRLYAGYTYIFHVDPEEIKKENYQIGFDYFYDGLLDNIYPFAGYDLKVIHNDKYTVNHSVNAGIKFGKMEGKGFSVYYHYYSGKSVHGEYYNFNREYSAIGFNVDL